MWIDYLPCNPLRPVGWRWHLAFAHRTESIPPRLGRPDPWVRAAIRYQDWIGGSRRRRPRGIAAIEAAYGIWSANDARHRYELELRLLSGQPYDVVADRCGVMSAVVEAFERLFYCVSDRLDCLDYIVAVIDPAMSVIFGVPTREIMLKRLAYGHGPMAADLLVDYLGGGTPPGVDPELDRSLRRLFAIWSVPVNEATTRFWIKLAALTEAFERETAAGSVATISMPVAVSSLLPVGILDRPPGDATDCGAVVAVPDPTLIFSSCPFPRAGEASGSPDALGRPRSVVG